MKEGGNRNRETAPLISVITVTFNAKKFIEACIESVNTQNYKNIEHVILDGGSTDGTIDSLERLNDKIGYWRSEPDKGIYDAMNKAVTYARGQWILFLGADDTLLPGFSEMAMLLTDKNCVYYGESQWKHVIHGGAFNPYRLAKFNICHQNIYYPRSIFDRYQYNTDYIVNADHFLNIQCFTDPDFRFEFHPILVSVYAADGYSSLNYDANFMRDKDAIIKKYFGKAIYYRYKLRKFRHFIKGKK
jgi:glycosyltransferase involved in cell wall biosynthesis